MTGRARPVVTESDAHVLPTAVIISVINWKLMRQLAAVFTRSKRKSQGCCKPISDAKIEALHGAQQGDMAGIDSRAVLRQMVPGVKILKYYGVLEGVHA